MQLNSLRQRFIRVSRRSRTNTLVGGFTFAGGWNATRPRKLGLILWTKVGLLKSRRHALPKLYTNRLHLIQAAPDLRPLLDDTVAVSATLEVSISTTETPDLIDYQTGEVGHTKFKQAAALDAKLSGGVFSSA